MTFTYNGHTYRMWWQHFTRPGSLRRTECTIVEITGPKESVELMSDDAFCADCDKYDKNVGRKLSLARALIRLTQDRQFRRVAWQAYHNRGRVRENSGSFGQIPEVN